MSLHPNPLSSTARAIRAISAFGLMTATLHAAEYTPGDLFLGFVAASGTGSGSTMVVNLGPASGYRDSFDSGTNKLAFVTIGTQLTTQFGADWNERPDLYVSLFASTSADPSPTSPTLFHGDPHRTSYVSAARSGTGTVGSADSSSPAVIGNTAMTTIATQILGVVSSYAGNPTNPPAADAQGVRIIPDSDANTLDEFTKPVSDLSFGAFAESLEQTFAAGQWGSLGDAGAVEAALDLFRMQARDNVAGQYGQGAGIRQGIYKGTITISQSGAVSFIAKGDATPVGGFDSWAVSKGLPTGVATDDDRDNDGIPALTEYALDLNPLAFNSLPAPVVAAGGLTLTFTKGAAAAADTKITYQIETSSTLNADWVALTPAVNDTTQISALLPFPASGDPARRFARLKIIQAD